MIWVRHSEGPPFRRSGTIVQSAFIGIKTDSANKRYLFNAIPDTNHNANPTNPNRYSKGNPSEWRTFGMADRYRWHQLYSDAVTPLLSRRWLGM